MATFNHRVNSDNDNAVERSDSTNFSVTRTELAGRSGAGGSPFWYSGFRFSGVTIPQGATINSASITFTSLNTESLSAMNNIVYGNDVDNAADFSSEPDVVDRTLTTANVTWALPTSITADVEYTSTDIKTVIQEIVDRGSWASGNAMVILNRPNTGTVGDDWNFYTHQNDSAKAVEIDIDYTVAVTFIPKIMMS